MSTPGRESPRVSILLPAHDAESTVEACLRSVVRQTEPRWECIVVDDGSTDRTAEIVGRFAADDPRFRLVCTPHRGLVAALNTGLERCAADLVARMDADDLMHRGRLREQLALLDTDPHLAACGCHVRLFPRAGLTDGTRAYECWLNSIDSAEIVAREAWIECPIAHPTLTVRRDVLMQHRYRDNGWPEDYDLLLRLLARGHHIGVVPRRRLAWRDHPQRLSRTSATYGLDRFTDCKSAHLANTVLANVAHYDLWGYGSTGRALRRALDRRGKHPRRIVEVHPRRLGQRIHGAPVIPPKRLPELPRAPLLVSVSGIGPRTLIRRFLATIDYQESRDYICTA